MVFGAITQANGFETGWNINNVRWTGDYWISTESYIADIDTDLVGSNIIYSASISINDPSANVCVLSLGTNYVLSSNISPPRRVPFLQSPTITALSFDPTGTVIYFSNTTLQQTFVYPLSTPFIIPPTISTFQLFYMAGIINSSGTSTATDKYYIYSNHVGDKGFLVNQKGGAMAYIPIPLLNSNYNTGGFVQGITAKRDCSVIFVLSNLNVANKTWLLSSTTFNKNLTAAQYALLGDDMQRKYNFVNIYPLFPDNMKPTNGRGIVFDREKGQWLFVNALINSKWTICKFQLRAT